MNEKSRISRLRVEWLLLLNVLNSSCGSDIFFFSRGGNYRAKRMKLSHMVISQGCAWPDARRNWLIYRCFRVAKTSKKAELDYAACTNCFIQMQFKGRASFADCKGEFKEAIVLGTILTYILSYLLIFFPVSFLFNFRFSCFSFLYTALWKFIFYNTIEKKFFSLIFLSIKSISNSKMILSNMWRICGKSGWVNRHWSMVHQSVWAPFSFDLSVT